MKFLGRKLVKKRLLLLSAFLVFIFFASFITMVFSNSNKKTQNKSQEAVSPTIGVKNGQTLGASTSKKLSPNPSPKPTLTLTPTLSPTPTPVAKKLHIGFVVEDYQNSNGGISSLEEKINKTIDTVSIYKQFGLNGNKDIDLNDLSYIKSKNIKLLLAWEPWNPEQGGSQSEDYLKGISQGNYDGYITQFADSLKTYGGNVVLRFGHEMNGDWYPWGKRPADYISAYRHIHDIFVKENVTNVSFMWSVNIEDSPDDLGQYYPGDSFVDEIGIDGFNFGTSQSFGGWRSFTDLFGSTYDYLVSNYSKPISISETASTEFGGDKALWIKSLFASELPKRFPKVSEIIWFNLLKETDWRIDSSGTSLQAFKDGISIL